MWAGVAWRGLATRALSGESPATSVPSELAAGSFGFGVFPPKSIGASLEGTLGERAVTSVAAPSTGGSTSRPSAVALATPTSP